MAIDESTGLPELPEGYFWRVKESVGDYLRIQMRRRVFFWSEVVEWSGVNKNIASKFEIQMAAKHVLLLVQEKKVDPKWRKYLGDYPPKKLGG